MLLKLCPGAHDEESHESSWCFVVEHVCAEQRLSQRRHPSPRCARRQLLGGRVKRSLSGSVRTAVVSGRQLPGLGRQRQLASRVEPLALRHARAGHPHPHLLVTIFYS
jgi:hypothetical protein